MFKVNSDRVKVKEKANIFFDPCRFYLDLFVCSLILFAFARCEWGLTQKVEYGSHLCFCEVDEAVDAGESERGWRTWSPRGRGGCSRWWGRTGSRSLPWSTPGGRRKGSHRLKPNNTIKNNVHSMIVLGDSDFIAIYSSVSAWFSIHNNEESNEAE